MDDLKHCSCICPSTYLYTRRSRACHRELEEASKHTYKGNRSNVCVCVCVCVKNGASGLTLILVHKMIL